MEARLEAENIVFQSYRWNGALHDLETWYAGGNDLFQKLSSSYLKGGLSHHLQGGSQSSQNFSQKIVQNTVKTLNKDLKPRVLRHRAGFGKLWLMGQVRCHLLLFKKALMEHSYTH